MTERNPEVAGGEQETQEQANDLEAAAAPSKARERQFRDLTPGSPPEGVEFADPRDQADPVPNYADEDEEFLFGATSRPNEPVNFGVTSMRAQPPKNVYQYLTALTDAAEDPSAPQQLHTFIRILESMLSEED